MVYRECLERALEIYEECYQHHHPSVVVALTNLGAVLHSLGETEKSKEPLEQALDMAEHLYEPNHPSVSNYVPTYSVLYGDNYLQVHFSAMKS